MPIKSPRIWSLYFSQGHCLGTTFGATIGFCGFFLCIIQLLMDNKSKVRTNVLLQTLSYFGILRRKNSDLQSNMQ